MPFPLPTPVPALTFVLRLSVHLSAPVPAPVLCPHPYPIYIHLYLYLASLWTCSSLRGRPLLLLSLTPPSFPRHKTYCSSGSQRAVPSSPCLSRLELDCGSTGLAPLTCYHPSSIPPLQHKDPESTDVARTLLGAEPAVRPTQWLRLVAQRHSQVAVALKTPSTRAGASSRPSAFSSSPLAQTPAQCPLPGDPSS